MPTRPATRTRSGQQRCSTLAIPMRTVVCAGSPVALRVGLESAHTNRIKFAWLTRAKEVMRPRLPTEQLLQPGKLGARLYSNRNAYRMVRNGTTTEFRKKDRPGWATRSPRRSLHGSTDENVSGHPQVSDFELEPVSRVEKHLMRRENRRAQQYVSTAPDRLG